MHIIAHRLGLVLLAPLLLLACQERLLQPEADPQPDAAATGPAFSTVATGTETRITTNPAQQISPAISGDRIVWTDSRNGNWDIYLYDLATGTETQVTTDPSSHGAPAISGNRIVWADDRNGNADIYLYDLTTGTETQITTDPSHQGDPTISGDRVVWNDQRNGNWDIYVYDLATGIETQVTTDPDHQNEPAISGDRIVWRDQRNGNFDIYLYDLATGTETQITSNPSTQSNPAISTNRIVWTDQRNGNSDIYLYDLATGTETQVTTDPNLQSAPAISGDRIVWHDNRNGNVDIYLYDLATGTETQITTDLGTQNQPAISGDRIVWRDERNGNPDIYALLPPQPGGILTEDLTLTAAESPHILSEDLQIPHGINLVIEPGAVVRGMGHAIEVWGTLDVAGADGAPAVLDDVRVVPRGTTSEPFQINIRHAEINRGDLYAATGNAVYGGLALSDSRLTDVGQYLYIWYPVSHVVIERNLFIRSGGISTGTDNVRVDIRNNTFYEWTTDYAVENWATYRDGGTFVELNSFLSTDRVAIRVPPPYDSAILDAPNNYWGTTSELAVQEMIFDKTDDPDSNHEVQYLPMLLIPDSNTPPLPGGEPPTGSEAVYWRFETDDLGAPSIGDAQLTSQGETTRAQLGSGPGSKFPRTLPEGLNDGALQLTGGRLTTTTLASGQEFTIEAFVHLNTLTGDYGNVIAGFGDARDTPWTLQVRLDQVFGNDPGELFLGGAAEYQSTWLALSGIVLEPGIDYYVAAAFDPAGDVTFWVQNLTNNQVVQSVGVSHNVVAPLPVDSRFTIGDNYDGEFDFELDGIVDEVRLHDRVLLPEELLIAFDSDGDGVPNGSDICPGGDDTLDSDQDGVPDACELIRSGSFSFTDQASFESALAGVTEIDGSLDLRGDGITDLSPLSHLTAVSNYLQIIDVPASLEPLSSLRSVESSLYLRDLPASAGGLLGLRNLESVRTFNLLNVDGLTDFADLASLTTVEELDVLGSITSLAGLEGVNIQKLSLAQTALTNLTPLPSGLKSITLADNALLEDISALSVLTNASTVTLNANPLITDLAGLSNLATVGDLQIQSMPGLTDLTGLSSLQSAGQLRISLNASLTSLGGLAPLTSVGNLSLGSNPVLTDLSVLASLTGVGTLAINNNDQLADLSGLSNLNNASTIQITENDLLTNLSGLASFSDATLEGQLTVSRNPALTDLSALGSIVTVNGTVEVFENSVLPNLTGFENLAFVGFLHISSNPLLEDCSALANLIGSGTVGGEPRIENNGAGCTLDQILSTGWTPTGSGVAVEPNDQSGQPAGVSLTFDEVTAPGETTVQVSTTGSPPPNALRLGSPPVYFDITTTASFSGTVELCFDYSGQSFGNEANLKLLHDDGGGWVDVTTSLDTINDIICGVTTSLSPFVVTEVNEAPEIVAVSLPLDPIALGGTALLSADFTDINPLDVHSGGFDWGAGVVAGIVAESAGTGTVTLSQTFAAPGVYTVDAVVSDGDLEGTRSSLSDVPGYLVVYDPSGSFVTGGGWIQSPPGACTWTSCTPATDGKASFGFVAKYARGANVPSGQTQFRFKAGDLDFRSTAYDWLVVAGARAQYRGTGEVNGMTGFGFMITAIDEAGPGGGTVDRFRIKIWIAATGEVIYDNQRGEDDTSDASTELGGGSIQIHG